MNSGCYKVALYLTNCVTSNIRTTFSSVSITLESFYSSFVAGIHLPHQGVVDSYDLYNGNPHKGEKIYIYIYIYWRFWSLWYQVHCLRECIEMCQVNMDSGYGLVPGAPSHSLKQCWQQSQHIIAPRGQWINSFRPTDVCIYSTVYPIR